MEKNTLIGRGSFLPSMYIENKENPNWRRPDWFFMCFLTLVIGVGEGEVKMSSLYTYCIKWHAAMSSLLSGRYMGDWVSGPPE